MTTTLTPTGDSTDRRAAIEAAITTGDRHLVLDGTVSDGLFYMTARDSTAGLTGARGAVIESKGAPRIEVLNTPGLGSDSAAFFFESTDVEADTSGEVSFVEENDSDDPDDWLVIDCNLECGSAILANARSSDDYDATGCLFERFKTIDYLTKGAANLRAGGVCRRFYCASTTTSTSANSFQADGGPGNQQDSVLFEHGEVGPMANAASGCMWKIGQMRSAIVRDIAVPDGVVDATNGFSGNLGENNGRVVVERVRLPGGLTHTSGGAQSADFLHLIDVHMGEGASGVINSLLLHNNNAARHTRYTRMLIDGIDRYGISAYSGSESLCEHIEVEDLVAVTYVDTGSHASAPTLLHPSMTNTFRVAGVVRLLGPPTNGLAVSSAQGVIDAWDAGQVAQRTLRKHFQWSEGF